MNANLILGCHGNRRFGFSVCRGSKNILLELNRLGSNTEEVLEHLDNHYKLFDSVITELNKVNNIVQYIIRQELVPSHIQKLLYEYLGMHRPCGFYVYIETNK